MRLSRSRPTATLLQSLRQRRWIGDGRPFAPGDLVILRQKIDRSAPPILTKPLKPGRRIESHKGTIQHDEIIGKRVRDIVKSSTTRSTRDPTEYRLHEVTLEEYTRLSRRLVTPIYPADANLIVNLLDLHPDAIESEDGVPKLEILEAGTGHGALTLHLSRAVHAANSAIQANSESDDRKAQRHAVIHTTDVSSQFSTHAQTVVEGFRQGIYARNVDFHVGDVSEVLKFLQSSRDSRDTSAFLSHAILDMPSADAHLATVADALRTDGTLIVFNPSITQIIRCAEKVKEQGIPLDLDKVVELGVNGGSGGREWDVRFIRPRAEEASPQETSQPETLTEAHSEGGDESTDLRAPLSAADRPWSLVCRPKVGDRIVGGGFLGVWKKQRDMRAETDQPSP